MQPQKSPTQPSSQSTPIQPQSLQQQQQQITPQTIQQFNKVCESATQLMYSYKKQSQDLKNQITSMVTIYNKNANPNQAVPVQKIIEITNVYQKQMKNAHNQYQFLENQLKKQQGERDDMMKQIMACFQKLEKMEKVLKEKKAKQAQQKKQNKDKQVNYIQSKVQSKEERKQITTNTQNTKPQQK